MKNILTIFFSSNTKQTFCILGSSESNQKSEKQILKEKLNKPIKSLQKNLKTTKKYGSNQIVKPFTNPFRLNLNLYSFFGATLA